MNCLRLLRPEVDIYARREAEAINIDREPQHRKPVVDCYYTL